MKKILVLLLAALFTLSLVSCAKKNATLSDGNYQIAVTMQGGSGRASVTSPTDITVSGGKITAKIEWSSPSYTYMIVDGVTYNPVNTEGNSVFEIPVVLDSDVKVIACTVAMSQPHEIEYTLRFDSKTIESK